MEKVRQILGNDKFAERNNIELLTVSPGRATAKMTLHPHHLNGIGTVQSGAIFTLTMPVGEKPEQGQHGQ